MISISYLFEEGTYFGTTKSYKYEKDPKVPISKPQTFRGPGAALNTPKAILPPKEKYTNSTFSDY